MAATAMALPSSFGPLLDRSRGLQCLGGGTTIHHPTKGEMAAYAGEALMVVHPPPLGDLFA